MDYENYLRDYGYVDTTIKAYLFAIRQYSSLYSGIDRDNLNSYKKYLTMCYSVNTVNLRINAVNSYIRFLELPIRPLHMIKKQKCSYLDNLISQDEYTQLISQLKKEPNKTLYFIVRYMAATGMRISEVLTLNVQDVRRGYKDIVSKGNKERRIFIPQPLSQETLLWAEKLRIDRFLFLNKSGNVITSSGVRFLLKQSASRYGIPLSHIHPHAFRHFFALRFLSANHDISMLSDILGHESLETTRIYLKKTREEQCRIINEVVNW